MVEIAEIRDRDSLEAWLEQENLPREAMVALAHRAAMRALPLAWRAFALDDWAQEDALTALPLLRAALVSGVAARSGVSETTKLKRVAKSAAEAAADAAISARAVLPSEKIPADAAAYAARAACDAFTVPGAAAYAAAAVAAAADAQAAHAQANAETTSGDGVSSASEWAALRAECTAVNDVPALLSQALGAHDLLLWVPDIIRLSVEPFGAPDWAFWLDWYQRALDGTEDRWPLLRDIALLDKDAEGRDIWDSPKRVAAEIARLEEAYAADLDDKTDLAKAYPVDFSFDALARVMRMVGIDDDMAHLRDPAVVQAFLDDCGELLDTLQDFADFAEAGASGSNRSGMLHLAAGKVLAELTRTRDEQHLRARHIVRLAQRLESFSKESSARDDLGETLSGVLDESVTLLRTVTRKHFGPAYTALAPLAQLSLDQIDRDAVLDLFDRVIARMETLPSDDLVALDEDGLSVFRDMVRELHDFRAAIAEASTDEFRAMMESRFAESIGGAGLAFGRFIETSATAAAHVGAGTDLAIRNYKRVKGLNDIVAFIGEFLGGGG